MLLRGKKKETAKLTKTKAPVSPTVKKMLRTGGLVVAVVLVLVVVLQFLYPSDHTLPYAKVNGTAAGNKTLTEVTPLLQDVFEDANVTFTAGRVTSSSKLSALGATLNSEKTAAQLMSYPWWQRALPFSLLWNRPDVKTIYAQFDDARLGEAAKGIAGKMTAEPKNGTVGINGQGEVVVTSAEDGIKVTPENVQKAVYEANYAAGETKVAVTPNITKPAVTNEMIGQVKAKITAVLARNVTLKDSLDAKASYTPDKATVAGWIHIGDDLKLMLDSEKVAAYANGVAKAQLVASGTTKITIVDGVETGRTNGAEGRGVNVTALVGDLSKALLEGSGDVTATIQFAKLAPAVVYERSYSNSQAALQAYLNDVTAGGNIEISVRQLSGAGWSAQAGANKSAVSASTYKLFISLLLFDKIQAGQIKWTDPIQGTTVETCLRNTIVLSANNCAEQWIGEWGRANINAALYAKGFSAATSFTTGDAAHTSAADLQKLLIGLQSRTMFNGSDADKLLGYMKQQVYRKGIPAGSGGVVADKVGFLWDYLNDAAIVYHPRGTYVLVIMTKGESWGKIAEITRQIEKIMYP